MIRSLCATAIVLVGSTIPVLSQAPSYGAPGDLAAGSGTGLNDAKVYYEGMRFPFEAAPAYANSQVYGKGGMHGGGGRECDDPNYLYPWKDNFCETRSWSMPMCPAGKGHQGQDIRPATCKADLYWAVAVADGVIANIGGYSVTLQTPDGTLFRYLHLNMDRLQVRPLDFVTRGQRIGLVSNHFNGTPTTVHLHFDIKDKVAIGGKVKAVYMPPYASLVDAYKRLLAGSP